uniref:Peptidyl-prolyl cis-trans isomerase n=1 Tax=candidate division WOR-3 bacterium TaxID=2052148 RepID=A0A7C4GE47_UNCW3
MRILLLMTCALLLVACGTPKPKPTEPPTQAETQPAPTEQPVAESTKSEPAPAEARPAEKTGGPLKDTLVASRLPEKLFLTIKVKDYGTMKVQMATREAPKNVTNVCNLAIKGFYNGLTFHRLIPGFMIQGGDPKGDGTGGPGYTVPAEIKLKHEKGSMAMARLGDQVNPKKESSGSQFYICFVPTPFLDGSYTVIGKLVSGMEVLDALERVKTGAMDRPTTPVVMESVFVTTE